MLVRIDRLTKEVERLRKTIGKRIRMKTRLFLLLSILLLASCTATKKLPLDRDAEQDGYRVAHAARRTKRRRANRTSGNGPPSEETSVLRALTEVDPALHSSGDGDGGEPP